MRIRSCREQSAQHSCLLDMAVASQLQTEVFSAKHYKNIKRPLLVSATLTLHIAKMQGTAYRCREKTNGWSNLGLNGHPCSLGCSADKVLYIVIVNSGVWTSPSGTLGAEIDSRSDRRRIGNRNSKQPKHKTRKSGLGCGGNLVQLNVHTWNRKYQPL